MIEASSLDAMLPPDLSPEQAIQLQELLRTRVIIRPLPIEGVRLVAGIDVGFRDDLARAAIVVVRLPTLELVGQAVAEILVPYPYIPGLLAFRELPVILKAMTGLETMPDVFMCDGHGLAHHRRFGLACHLGVLLDRPTLGCAKSILTGRAAALEQAPGSISDLLDGEEVIGAAVRTQSKVKPVYVSVGNLIDLASAIEVVLACSRGNRLPEPMRLADRLASGKCE